MRAFISLLLLGFWFWPMAAQGQTLVQEVGSTRTGMLSASDLSNLCKAAPRACLSVGEKQNQKFSRNGRVIKGLSEKEWRAVCAAVDKLPVCQMPEKEREKWLASKPGRVCSQGLLWTPKECEGLAQGKIELGMTQRMIFAAWGPPKTRYSTSHGNEEWVYGDVMWAGMGRYGGFYGRMVYLFFQDGLLKSTSETRHGG